MPLCLPRLGRADIRASVSAVYVQLMAGAAPTSDTFCMTSAIFIYAIPREVLQRKKISGVRSKILGALLAPISGTPCNRRDETTAAPLGSRQRSAVLLSAAVTSLLIMQLSSAAPASASSSAGGPHSQSCLQFLPPPHVPAIFTGLCATQNQRLSSCNPEAAGERRHKRVSRIREEIAQEGKKCANRLRRLRPAWRQRCSRLLQLQSMTTRSPHEWAALRVPRSSRHVVLEDGRLTIDTHNLRRAADRTFNDGVPLPP